MIDLTAFESRAVPLRALGVVVSQNGTQLARKLWDDACRRNVYSASKSFTSMAVGIAQKEGLLSIDEKLTDAFKDDLPEIVSDNLKAATVRDLLTMCLGQEKSFLMGGERPYYEDRNWVRLALRQPFGDGRGDALKDHGTDGSGHLAGILVQRRAGCDLVHYLMPRMFAPMGIQLPTWENDPNGQTFGAGGLFLTIDELHLFGQLLLQNGEWNGKQLIPAEWVKEATSKQVENGSEGYGYLFWAGPEGSFRADGKYGQFVILMRDKNAVVTVTAESRDAGALLRAVFEEIYPQL